MRKSQNNLGEEPENCIQSRQQRSEEAQDMSTVSDLKELEDLLVPKDGNLGKSEVSLKKKRTPRKKKIDENASVAPKVEKFKTLNPESNCNEFLQLYRLIIKGDHVGARFPLVQSERATTTKIMDELLESKCLNNQFIHSWIRYYSRWHLKGNRAKNLTYTQMSAFKKTLEEFRKRYYEG